MHLKKSAILNFEENDIRAFKLQSVYRYYYSPLLQAFKQAYHYVYPQILLNPSFSFSPFKK